jgi:hypothetical protein|tara:strand:- start:1985 stop:2248 length:264 start_codon:yes stop_codon:yes gene_type:complete
MDYDDENENNNEPFFIPIARTFTVDLFEDRVLETFFVFDDDRTTLMCVECKANMMIDVCCCSFLCGVGEKRLLVSLLCLCGLFFTTF